jgi:hypothetical protein
MKYRVFIASTYADLVEKRRLVIQRLRKADLDVICMEDFAADNENPALLSQKRVRDCHFCVALIAYQKGTASSVDTPDKSITQLEIDAAKRFGLVVLPYLLRESAENVEAWPAEFNDLKDDETRKWRAEIALFNTTEFFDADGEPDPLPAIIRQITKREKTRRGFLQFALACLILALCALTFGPFFFPEFSNLALTTLHRYHDPVAFREPSTGKIKVARLLENRSELQGAGFGNDIAAANSSFVLTANTFGSFRSFQSDFEAAAKRGVKLRFILVDFSNDRRPEWKRFIEAIEDSPQALDEMATSSLNIRHLIRGLQAKYPGNVEYKLHGGPLFYTMWLRDQESHDSLGHISIPLYGKSSQSNWPSIRVSKKTGGTQIDTLAMQFELLWNKAYIDEVVRP